MGINDYKNTLDNKIVLITGAGGGIGFETAKYFAIMGAKVIILELPILWIMSVMITIIRLLL